MRPSFLPDVRRSEYTGADRCWPCTVVNVALVGVGGATLAVVASPILGAAAAVVGLALVWLRGYLIPGTPRFAPPLVAAIPGGDRLFHGSGVDDGGDPPAAGGSIADEEAFETGADLLERLVDAGVLEADGEAIRPTAAYDERWHAEMERLRELGTGELAAAAGAVSPAAKARAVHADDEWIALSPEGGATVDETWLTRPVAIAEVAGYRATEGFLTDDAARLAAAETNRMFLRSCPDCGAELRQGVDMPCCGGHTGPGEEPAETLVCPECAVRLYTFD